MNAGEAFAELVRIMERLRRVREEVAELEAPMQLADPREAEAELEDLMFALISLGRPAGVNARQMTPLPPQLTTAR